MTSLPTSLTVALTAITSKLGDQQVVNVFTELRLYLEHNKDQLDAANAKSVQLEAELNQVNGELNAVSQSLAMALARPALSNPLGGTQAPKLSKIFTDPRTYDGSRGKKFEEWWTHIHVWQDENSTALAGAAGIHTMLSRMVGGDASTFARAQLNEMIRGKKWTWTEFTALVEGNFWSSNEKDWNRKALSSLKQGLTPMDMFITRFDTFQALAQYPEDQLIELLEQNANQQIVERLILEKGCYTTVVDFKKDLKEAGSRKQLLNFIKSGTAERAKTRDPNAMDIDAAWSGNSKCFNCGGEHFTKECKKPKLQCGECKFLGGSHKKDYSQRGKGGRQARSAKTEEGAPPGIRIKAPKRKKKTRARAATGPSPFKECLWTRQGPGSNIMKTWLQSREKPRLKAPIWVC